MDYRLRGVAIENNDYQTGNSDRLNYYSQRARFYMTSWLNQDVEASLRLQSINIWGLEGSGVPVTRYPKADGSPWVEEAYIHLPNVAWKKLNLLIGRQPLVIGDGMLVSDDNLGFNAIRTQFDLPFKWDADAFTAKISEGLGENDFDLHGVVLGTLREHNRWELAWIRESNDAASSYRLAATTQTATDVMREFYDVRLHGRLKDAFYKLEYAIQGGTARLAPNSSEIKLDGTGQRLELGAQTDTVRFGRFGVRTVYAVGTGDDAGTPKKDEAFRPTFARRWDGLQRSGYGVQYAATLSDAYDPAQPFAANTTGLPAGFSGIKTMGFGIFSTQRGFWTGSIDYFIYEARTKPTGQKDLGTELDGEMTYRYTGFVTFNLGAALFFPGQIYGNTASRVTRYTAEAHIHF
ncbi:MAG: hypothetical protein HY548_07320 [Elusimicrobia bacterium]|nr:hypothetical protein [Elusimicrobiota bacterium]